MANTADYTRRAIDKYRAKFDIIQIKAPKGTKERITTLSSQSMAAFCLQCVLDRLDELERSETAPEHEHPANAPTDSENENTTVAEAHTEKKPLTDEKMWYMIKSIQPGSAGSPSLPRREQRAATVQAV